ncbi:zinc ribbon domain-containing protein [Thermoproteus tenax]|uniref:zinc ribbon domain-containing protein n=1 Tax=Thermoproteus tenax TaxID=2271 RepID=UPI003B83514C
MRRLHERISDLERRAAREADPARRMLLEERARRLKSRRFRRIRDVVARVAEEIIELAGQNNAAIVIDVMDGKTYIARKQSGEGGVKKHLYDGLGQLRKGLKKLAKWYGLQYREVRLYSAICPRCGAKMEEEKRIMRCPACGFSDHRDNIPLLWAKRRYWEILRKQPAFSSLVAITLLTS